MNFQDIYDIFYYDFPFWLQKAPNMDHFTVFNAKINFLLVKFFEKNSEFAVVQICATGFDLILWSTIPCTKSSQFFNGVWQGIKFSTIFVIRKIIFSNEL